MDTCSPLLMVPMNTPAPVGSNMNTFLELPELLMATMALATGTGDPGGIRSVFVVIAPSALKAVKT